MKQLAFHTLWLAQGRLALLPLSVQHAVARPSALSMIIPPQAVKSGVEACLCSQ